MILVTGGAGVLGSRLVHGLVQRGEAVRVLALPGDPLVSRLDGLGCDVVYGDVADAASLAGVCAGVETVYHLAAVILTHDDADYQRINVDGTRDLVAEARSAGVRHFVSMSSIAVEWPEGSAYAQSKLAGEEVVRAAAMPWTIVRPTLIYDGRGGGMEYALFAEHVLRWPFVPFVGSGMARKRPVHADDIVRGLLEIHGKPVTHGKTYTFSGGETVTMRELAELIRKRHGRRGCIVPLPVPLCRLAAWVMEATLRRPPLTRYAISRFLQDAAPDAALAKRDLGYDPIGVRRGLTRSASLEVGKGG